MVSSQAPPYALPLDYYAGDNDFSYTLLSNDKGNHVEGGEFSRSSFRSFLPGIMDFGRTSHTGDEEGEYSRTDEKWTVALHKAIMLNYQQNAPRIMIRTPDGRIEVSRDLPKGHYPNWNSVYRACYNEARKNPVVVNFKRPRIFREQSIHNEWGLQTRAWIRPVDVGAEGRFVFLEDEQSVIQNLEVRDATVKQVLDTLVKYHSLKEALFPGVSRVFRDFRSNASQRLHHLDQVSFGLMKTEMGRYRYKPRNYKTHYGSASDQFMTWIVSEDLGILLGLHHLFSTCVIHKCTLERNANRDFLFTFSSPLGFIEWKPQLTLKRYASELPTIPKNLLYWSIFADVSTKTIITIIPDDREVCIVNEQGQVLNTIRNQSIITFDQFFTEVPFYSGLESTLFCVGLNNVSFESTRQGKSSRDIVMQNVLHSFIPINKDSKVIEFYPKPKRHERRLQRQVLTHIDLFVRDAADWNKEPQFYTGANAFVFTFSKNGIDWYDD